MRIAQFACLAFSLLLIGFASARAQAKDLTVRWVSPAGEVFERREMGLEDLDKLAQTTLHTSTPWTKGEQDFAGPSLATLAALGKRPVSEAKVTALNDYVATVPAEDWTVYRVILASRLNGNTMRVRDKGPYWVMYPIDSDEKLGQQYYQSRMVWQVKSIDFVTQ